VQTVGDHEGVCRTVRCIEYCSFGAYLVCAVADLSASYFTVLNGRLFDCDDERRNWPGALRVDFRHAAAGEGIGNAARRKRSNC
jgi:hypothetical protein